MCDIGERPAMHERRIVLQRLHQVGLDRVLQEHRHGAVGIEVAGKDRALVAAIGDDDVAQPLFEVPEVRRQAQDRHHLGGDGDVETRLARIAVGHAA